MTAGAIAVMYQGNMVRVGKKPVLSYVVACVTLFNSGKREIMVRARGRSIPKAIEAVGMLRRSFLKELTVKSVNIGSENIKRYNGRGASVSTIEITLTKREENESGMIKL
ncbi:MAG: DNA-binding protein Alba [Candidatus Bathyarchaeia archaeon]